MNIAGEHRYEGTVGMGKIMMVKALIVDDSKIFRHALKDVLKRRFPQMELEEAKDGADAMEKIATLLPDLVLMDVRLPGGNGFDLLKKIRVNHPEVCVIMLSHYDLPEYREAATDGGAEAFISKGSIDLDELRRLIEFVLEERARKLVRGKMKRRH